MKTKFIPTLARWLLSFGGLVEVLEPELLRRSVAEELRLALGVYERNASNCV